MAVPKKDGDVWRHRIMVRGQRVSGTFRTKAAALAWEAEQRVQIKEGSTVSPSKTLRDAFERYELEVSKKKRSYANEAKRLTWFANQDLAAKKMAEIKPADIAAWRDARLQEVKGSSVNRDMNLLSHVFTIARREWGWITTSPTKDVERPKDPPHRDRRISEEEIDLICPTAWLEPRAEDGTDDEAASSRPGVPVCSRDCHACRRNLRASKR
jgi:hypothetical protein